MAIMTNVGLPVSLNDTTIKGYSVGDIQWVGTKGYRLVLCSGGATVGQVAVSTADATPFNVAIAIASNNLVQGVFAATLTSGNLGFVQWYGYNSGIAVASGAIASGVTLIVGTGGKAAAVASGTAPTAVILGHTLTGALSGATSVSGFLRVM